MADSYIALAPIKDFVGQTVVITDLSTYLNSMFKLGIAIAIALAVIMLIYGGLEYVMSGSFGGKSDGKERVQAALLGLVIVLSSFAILNTINPNLLNSKLDVAFVSVEEIPIENIDVNNSNYGGGTNAGGQEGSKSNFSAGGVTGKQFPDYGMGIMALNAVNQAGLPGTSPTDKDTYLPNGGTDQDWRDLFAGIASKESGFDPNQTYTEKFKDNNGNNVISTGLLQISQESARAYGFPNITTEQLKDPQTNLNVGAAIMKRWVTQDGCISCKDANGNWRGGARYWSTLRN